MFKNIFDNKIGEKLNTFNSSGKTAFEWVDKFRQSIDITEKLQQQLNNYNITNTPPSNNPQTTTNNQNNSQTSAHLNSANSEESINATINAINNESSPATNIQNISNNLKKSLNNKFSNLGINFPNFSNNNSSQESATESSHNPEEIMQQNNQYLSPSPPGSPNKNSVSSLNSILSPKNSVKHNPNQNNGQQRKNLLNSNHFRTPVISSESNQSLENNTNSSNSSSSSANPYEHSNLISSPSNLSNETSTVSSQQHQLYQSKSLADDDAEYTREQRSRSLVRQSTDLTSSFPLKPFQKINSETIEIPGLNVKVVRYRVGNDLGKIEPHLYKKYNTGGIDSNASLSKGKQIGRASCRERV